VLVCEQKNPGVGARIVIIAKEVRAVWDCLSSEQAPTWQSKGRCDLVQARWAEVQTEQLLHEELLNWAHNAEVQFM
jgi:hypothetical protein